MKYENWFDYCWNSGNTILPHLYLTITNTMQHVKDYIYHTRKQEQQ